MATCLGLANHPSFEGCTVNTSDDLCLQMNNLTNEIVQDTITTDDSTIACVSTMLDDENEDNAEIINGINGKSSPCMIHTVVLPKTSLIDATVNLAIMPCGK